MLLLLKRTLQKLFQPYSIRITQQALSNKKNSSYTTGHFNIFNDQEYLPINVWTKRLMRKKYFLVIYSFLLSYAKYLSSSHATD